MASQIPAGEAPVLTHMLVTRARRLKQATRMRYSALLAWRMVVLWRALRRVFEKDAQPAVRPVARLALLPSDPHTLIGAKGDEAMMKAAMHQLAQGGRTICAAAVTGSERASAAALELGLTPLPVWNRGLAGLVRGILAFRPDLLLVVGADVMDGFYDPGESAKRIASADLVARHGVPTAILGFSFSAAPHPTVLPLLRNLSSRLRLNVRDPVSLANLARVSSVEARPVADVAFLLDPAPVSQQVGRLHAWITGRRSAGDVVLAFNVHPQLVSTREQIAPLVAATVVALRTLLEGHALSVMLLDHDYRDQSGDHVCHARVFELLRDEFRERLLYPTELFTAAELKTIVGALDGVVTGRMHLAIAALGAEVPVAALSYQGKFQGLFAQFGIPEGFVLPPAHVTNAAQLLKMCEAFLANLTGLRDQVRQRMPAVKTAAAANLDEFVAASPMKP